jgi:hypothetical protein
MFINESIRIKMSQIYEASLLKKYFCSQNVGGSVCQHFGQSDLPTSIEYLNAIFSSAK